MAATPSVPAPAHFGDRLIAAIDRFGPLCVGIDPYSERLPSLFGGPGPAAISNFVETIVPLLAGKVAAIKPQIALFERWGPAGLIVLQCLIDMAREAGLLVILDAKRGDIGDTAAGYAAAYLGPDAWAPADALTVNPYMGVDTLAPFLAAADAHGRGIAVLVRTSNPGAAALQGASGAGEAHFLRVADALAPLAAARVGASGWSSVMVVVGATAPADAPAVRERLPTAPFLVPGFGNQGATAADALAGLHAGRGVLVNASRNVIDPPGAREAASLADWSSAIEAGRDAARAALDDALKTPA